MAKGLATLVRVNEWTVDERRRALGVLLRELDELEAALRRLEQEVQDEQTTAGGDPGEAGFLYGVYAQGVIQRREALQEAIRAKEGEITEAREVLNEAYRELKKFEVIRDARDKREREERDRKDQIALDELGVETFRRRST